MSLAVACTALLGALLFLLGANVTRERIALGDRPGQYTSDPTSPLFQAVRAHANTAEYVPMLVVLMLLVQAREPSTAADVACVAATTARCVFAAALIASVSLEKPTLGRSVGASLTVVSGLALAILAAATL